MQIRDLVMEGQPLRFLDVACLRSDLANIFSGLVVDVCVRLAEQSDDPLATVSSLIEDWRALLEPGSSAWTRSRCAGLFAELLLVERLLAREPASLERWVGPKGAAQDFRAHYSAIEVKATLGAEGRVIRIHGSDQLEIPADGSLHIAWFRLVIDDLAGVSVRELLARVASRAADPKSWAEAIAPLKPPQVEHEIFDGCRFAALEERWYSVTDNFPRIVPRVFATGAVPAGVGGIEYLVDLDSVATSLRVDDPEAVLDELIGAK